jgi:hypothetical protein
MALAGAHLQFLKADRTRPAGAKGFRLSSAHTARAYLGRRRAAVAIDQKNYRVLGVVVDRPPCAHRRRRRGCPDPNSMDSAGRQPFGTAEALVLEPSRVAPAVYKQPSSGPAAESVRP